MKVLIMNDEIDELFDCIEAVAKEIKAKHPKKPNETNKRYRGRVDRLICKEMDKEDTYLVKSEDEKQRRLQQLLTPVVK